LLPYLAKKNNKREFRFKKEITSSVLLQKPLFKENEISQKALKKLAFQNFGARKCFQLVSKLASQKPFFTKTK
jgi:hypothetical protein